MNKIKGFALGFVPRYMGNGLVIVVYDMLSKIYKVSKETIADHAEKNRTLLNSKTSFFVPGRFIEKQAQWEVVLFGKKTAIKQSGCGALASYNALVALGEKPDVDTLVELIRCLETKGVVMGGMFGVSPLAIRRYFTGRNFIVREYKGKSKEKMEHLGAASDAIIVIAFNSRNDLSAGAHYICITKKEDGTYAAHNTYCYDGAKGCYCERNGFSSVSEAIENMNQTSPKAIWLMGITKA